MINFDFKSECYSCGFCMEVCPKYAISFDADLFPVVDKEKCVNCGLCEKNCIHLNCNDFKPELPVNAKAFAAKSKYDDVRGKSSSGGMFWHIAKHVIENSGAVCGVRYDKIFMPEHALVMDMDAITGFMGSKYVQSDMSGIYEKMEKKLSTGRQVCFSGVPCQIEAVYRAFEKYRDQLLLVAVVCHGSIERKVWAKYLVEEGNEKKIKYVSMRDKSNGWLNYGLKFVFDDGTEHTTYRKQNGFFLKCFTDGLLERDRCLKCQYKGDSIHADILLGDGWGMDKKFPDLEDSLGVSSVICLTDKGRQVYDSISSEILAYPTNIADVIAANQRIISAPSENKQRKKFLKNAMKQGIDLHDLCRKYAAPTLLNRVRSKLRG